MATSLQARVRHLEGSGSRCPECSFGGDWSKVRPVVDPHSTHKRNRYCGTCGRPTHIVLRWGDDRV
jgi:hypothetical protein